MKQLLYVGPHTGGTVKAVTGPRDAFARRVCFEPVQSCRRELERFTDGRVVVCPCGRWTTPWSAPTSSPGAGRQHSRRPQHQRGGGCLPSARASGWFRDKVAPGGPVYMQLNCEASECDVPEDLVRSGEVGKVEHLMVDFDVREFPSRRHRAAELRALPRGLPGTRLAGRERAMAGPTYVARIQHWPDRADRRVYFSTEPSGAVEWLRRVLRRSSARLGTLRHGLSA